MVFSLWVMVQGDSQSLDLATSHIGLSRTRGEGDGENVATIGFAGGITCVE